MNKETVETAANKYSPDPLYTDGQWEFGDVIDGFKAGAEWQEQQSANQAVEFADWLCENGWASSPPMWVNGEASDDCIGGQGTYTELTSQQLYELWLQTKTQ